MYYQVMLIELTLKYYNPLQLIDKIDGNDEVLVKKINILKNTITTTGGKTIKTGGVSIGQVFATGAYVNNSTSSTGDHNTFTDRT